MIVHHTAQIKIENINRGDLLMVAGGYVVADALSAAGPVEDPQPFWYDTDGGRHFPNPTDGTLTVRVATFRTHAHGVDRDGISHALLNPVPGKLPQGYCEGARDAGSDLDVWESGTSLAAVTCPDCRRAVGLVNRLRGERKRESNGI